MRKDRWLCVRDYVHRYTHRMHRARDFDAVWQFRLYLDSRVHGYPGGLLDPRCGPALQHVSGLLLEWHGVHRHGFALRVEQRRSRLRQRIRLYLDCLCGHPGPMLDVELGGVRDATGLRALSVRLESTSRDPLAGPRDVYVRRRGASCATDPCSNGTRSNNRDSGAHAPW